MVTYCILTVLGSFYLRALTSGDAIVTLETGRDDSYGLWTLTQNTQNGAYRICNYDFPKYCLGVAEGRPVQNAETVTLQDANTANPIYWVYNSTEKSIRPYGYDSAHLYMIGVDTNRNWKPVQLWYMAIFDPNMLYTTFEIKVC